MFKNPCKVCLTRPVCKNICDDLRDYDNLIRTIIYILFTTFVGIIILTMGLITYKFYPNIFTVLLFISMLIWGFIHSLKEVYTDNEFSSYKLWQKILLFIFAPLLLLSVIIWDVLPFESIIDCHIYKYALKNKMRNF